MLLRSLRVTEKIFGSRSSPKKNNFAAKAVKNVRSSTQSFGTKQLEQFYKITILQLGKENSLLSIIKITEH